MPDQAGDPTDADGVSLFQIIILSPPWPPLVDVHVTHDDVIGVDVFLTALGRIRVEKRDDQGNLLASTVSARIRLRRPEKANLLLSAVLIKDASDFNLRINGTSASATSALIRLGAVSSTSGTILPAPTASDPDSDNARKRRLQRSADQRRNGIDEERQAANLARETRLLKAALQRLDGGDDDEIVNVSLHLRKIIGDGKGNHALQDYAGLRGKMLDVWIAPPPPSGIWAPNDMRIQPHLSWRRLASIEQTPTASFLIDFDAWLAREDITIGGLVLSHLNLLHAISDKIGAHLDVGATPTLDYMGKIELFEVSFIGKYLFDLGHITLALCERVLNS